VPAALCFAAERRSRDRKITDRVRKPCAEPGGALLYSPPVDPRIYAALRERAPAIIDRWRALIAVEKVRTPLANPDALEFWVPKAVEQVLEAAGKKYRAKQPAPVRVIPAHHCECARNPYLSFYRAGERALVEMLFVIESELCLLESRADDLTTLQGALDLLAAREVNGYCRVCTVRESCGKLPRPCEDCVGAPWHGIGAAPSGARAGSAGAQIGQQAAPKRPADPGSGPNR
jgi:hypothetical protein